MEAFDPEDPEDLAKDVYQLDIENDPTPIQRSIGINLNLNR